MTTSRLTIRREHARDWPMFQDVPLPGDAGVLSIEAVRAPLEDLGSAVADAASLLLASWPPVLTGVRKLVLVAAGQAVRPSGRVAAYSAERNKLWAALEKDGLRIPDGRRLESKVQYDDGSFGFVGLVEIDPSGLPRALEVTRRANAACIGTVVSEAETLVDEVARSLAARSVESRSLIKILIIKLDQGDSVARGFGEFDDRTVGVEVYAKDDVLDKIEASIAQNR